VGSDAFILGFLALGGGGSSDVTAGSMWGQLLVPRAGLILGAAGTEETLEVKKQSCAMYQ